MAISGIFLLSVLLRLASAWAQGDGVAVLPGIADQVSYDALARRVLGGHGFSFAVAWWPATGAGEPTAHWSFLYTLYLAAAYWLFGPHPLAARLIQAAFVAIIFPWLGWRLGSRLFGPAAGLATAVVLGLYPYFVYYSGALMTEPFYIAAILWSLDLATGKLSRVAPAVTAGPGAGARALRALWPWALLGFALGTTVLLRQLFALFIPFLLLWLLWPVGSRRAGLAPWVASLRRHSAGLLMTVAIIGCMVAPWTFRNYLAFGRLVPLNTNAGYAFFWANHPVHGTDFIPILPEGRYRQLIPPELRSLDEAALDQALLRHGLAFVIEDPWRYLQLSASRIPEYFDFWPSAESGLPGDLTRLGSFALLVPAAAWGLWLAATRRTAAIRDGERSSVLLVLLFVLVYTSIHVLTWTLVRYRLPVDAAMALFAGLGYSAVIKPVFCRSAGVTPARSAPPENSLAN